MLSSLAIAFLPRSKRLLISWLQSPSAVILENKKIKFLTVSIVSPSICQEVMGPDASTQQQLVNILLQFIELERVVLVSQHFIDKAMTGLIYIRKMLTLLANDNIEVVREDVTVPHLKS